jgi:hypothetical protein
MSYIVDLTLVMEQLFFVILPTPVPRRVTKEHIEIALENYKNSDASKVHREIRQYASRATFLQICQSNNAQGKVVELISKYGAYGADRSATESLVH